MFMREVFFYSEYCRKVTRHCLIQCKHFRGNYHRHDFAYTHNLAFAAPEVKQLAEKAVFMGFSLKCRGWYVKKQKTRLRGRRTRVLSGFWTFEIKKSQHLSAAA